MTNRNLGRIIRCTGFALLVLGVLALVPADAQAGVVCTPSLHGGSIEKSCTSPRNSCATDADCSDGNACNGAEQCATEDSPGSNVLDCTITFRNPAAHCDSITVTQAEDAVTNGTGSPSTSSDILVVGTTGAVSGPGCDAGSNLGGAEVCTLAPGAAITFRSNFYTVQAADPNPLADQATVTSFDNCDGPSTGCGTTPNGLQFGASSTLQTGCSAGTPLNCDDGLFCTDDSCVAATGCAHTTHDCADADECTIDSCDEDNDMCDHDPDPACEVTEFCRTPGFWGTHADEDDKQRCSQNITQAVLDAAGGSISVCGATISNTACDSANSAIEAICVRVQGDSPRQLARQLTAARLNCIVSGETGGPCNGISINEIFDKCDIACTAGEVVATVGTDEVDCIDAIDCFNNGGTFDPSDGSCHIGNCAISGAECSDDDIPCGEGEGECLVGESCHTQPFPEDFPLPNNSLSSSDPCFEKQGPAGSSEECKVANKSACTVLSPGSCHDMACPAD